ncbi:MAG: hypothetical protein DWB56_06740 [Candidatus Jettenia sp.]|uniref:Phage protein n=1 Tax=Candidatus Jettenia caeni TaxID=247490 RepID=I3IN05_9BACT|nr:hypothetical protein [Candidatus Jettenia sp. AMX1]MBC6928650.1 hypothetical protein [Candidatus Jettenia sp.]GAB63100.1 hypothetical protein KSU1_C1504 [Candidatus Jettenia caeni]KAA0250628.1 MAG: hypothetical protein EDM77_03680 [Candidatus Jettenia sp. AMX1]MCE7879962.1 hypothetical protein [Candidatus Jettenia sp. AMX1]MCQ3926744.1 hypothetical protein [Candidatus Jettenia sp.]
MGKNTAQEIIDLGFIREMFRKEDDAALSTFIDGVISEQTKILEGRIGSAAYASVISPVQDYVKRAEKCLAAVELIGRRIMILLSNVPGAGQAVDIRSEERKRDYYMNEAHALIAKIVAGVTADGDGMGFGVVESSHF